MGRINVQPVTLVELSVQKIDNEIAKCNEEISKLTDEVSVIQATIVGMIKAKQILIETEKGN